MKTLLEIAHSQYGVTEEKGKLHNPTIVNYFKEIGHQWVSNDETAWCSAFMNWIALKAGKKKSGKLNARSWLTVGRKVTKPIQGDVVVLWRDQKRSWKGHVGLFINYSEDKKHIYVLGGNQNNQVNIKRYPAYRLLGFRRLTNT
ncbi:TIGR02594 family protein [Kordia sp.]|uniref:TIGR02594 family protein n=1 Tax=Kordia sp. TaxID=1965332 RepID=UPI003D26624A